MTLSDFGASAVRAVAMETSEYLPDRGVMPDSAYCVQALDRDPAPGLGNLGLAASRDS